MAANTPHVLLDDDCSIRVYQSFVAIFQIFSIMLNAFSDHYMFKIMLA